VAEIQKKTPKKVVNLLDKVSAEDLAKIQDFQASTEGAYPVDNEWLLLAEFAKAFGWQAYIDARDDRISAGEMMTLIKANRKLEALDHYKNAEASFIGAGSAKAKRPSSAFKILTKNIINQAKVKE
jgi:hypothetical protein